jgi:hypothetical protein
MGRCTVIRWAFAAGVLCCWGCSAPNSFSPFGWMQGSNSAQTTATKDPSNPLKPADASATASGAGASTAAGASATASTNSADGAKAAAGGGFKSAPIDPALRKLMEDELKFEPADKRQQLLADWSKFDPAFIRELVENHRMARELAESHHGGKDSGWDGGGAAPVKTASKEQPPQMPVFDDPTAPKDSVLHERPSTQTPVQLAATSTTPATPSSGAVSPWDDAPSTSPLSPRKTAAPTLSLAQAPVAPAGAPSAKSDPWDFDGAPKAPGTAQQKPDSKQIAATPPASGAPFATGTPSAPAAPKGDAFADMTPIDTDPVAPPSRPKPTGVSSPQVALSGAGMAPVKSASLDAFDDGPKIQAGAAAPAGVIAGLQPSGSATPAVIQAAGTAATDGSGVGLASATSAAPTNPPNVPESEQPVKLSLPVDVPEGQVVTAADAGSTPARAAQASAAARPTSDSQTAATAAAAQTSGLASLPSRLLGAINTLPGTGGSRNISLPANWHDELQKIVSVAASEAGQTSVGSSDAEKLAYIQKQVNLRMLYLLSGQPARSLEPIAGLEPADQEFWQQVFWGMSSYFDHTTIADPRDRATQTIAQLRQAVNKLQEKSKLELRNVSFCNKIENYGRYERFKRDEFTAGQPVLLYAEVENFKSEQVNDGYRVILKSTIEIFDSRGTLVHKNAFAANEDQCSSPRRDYYNSYEFSIPQQISLGPHTLKLTVEDQLSQKVASYSVNFTVK